MFNHSLSGEVNIQNSRLKGFTFYNNFKALFILILDEMYKSYSNFGKFNNKYFDVNNDNQMRHTQR